MVEDFSMVDMLETEQVGRNMYQERIKNLREQARKLYGISLSVEAIQL